MENKINAQCKATGSFVSHRPRIVKVKDNKKLKSFFDSKSLSIIKADCNSYLLSINKKLAIKLGLNEYVQVKLFPEANALFIAKELPFPTNCTYRLHDGSTLILDDATIAEKIVQEFNLDLSDCKALVSRNISYQPAGDGYMAIVFLNE